MEKYARIKYQPCLPLGEDGRRATGSKKHIELSRTAAGEGMVLLKNENNVLPLKKGSKIALFGKASLAYVKSGGGSGDVHCEYVRNVFDGFHLKEKEEKVFVFNETKDFYQKHIDAENTRIAAEWRSEKAKSIQAITDTCEWNLAWAHSHVKFK